MTVEAYVRRSLQKQLERLSVTPDTVKIEFETPRDTRFGDLATNVAMLLARALQKNPREIARQLIEDVNWDSSFIESVNIAGPGFINFVVSKTYLQGYLKEILNQGEADFGKSRAGAGKKIQIEFVSANPTGPLNVVSARAASVGDTMVNIMTHVGYEAKREYYVNDAGRQVRLLGASVSSRYCHLLGVEEPFPEEGYHGNYVTDLAKEIISKYGDRFLGLSREERVDRLKTIALEMILADQKKVLEDFRVRFDRFFHESDLRKSGAEQEVLSILKEKSLTYEKEGALWFKASQFGDEKDRVLITQKGEPTYFFIDVAYHKNKFNRGFEKVIDLLGPDHHGYIPRMRAALLALGFPEDAFDVKIIQQVNLFRGGEVVKMSKRAGQIVTMRELVDEVGVDAARFFFLMRRISTPLDFDIDLAKKQTDENPVYYVQYAHARIANILRYGREQGISYNPDCDLSLLVEPEEMALIKKMRDFPDLLVRIVRNFEPNSLTQYLQELAEVFHRFYHDHRVISEDKPLSEARIALSRAVKIVLAIGLKLMGISAPEKM
ncbi:MAG: arginine--tRNA ligase [Calditrichaeota bacterium]|nr:arginine--tRNA ligase [Calditrichota bacterium]